MSGKHQNHHCLHYKCVWQVSIASDALLEVPDLLYFCMCFLWILNFTPRLLKRMLLVEVKFAFIVGLITSHLFEGFKPDQFEERAFTAIHVIVFLHL